MVQLGFHTVGTCPVTAGHQAGRPALRYEAFSAVDAHRVDFVRITDLYLSSKIVLNKSMPSPSMLNSFIFEMDLENFLPIQAKSKEDERQRCSCLRTSDKLKRILSTFPSPPPPPSPAPIVLANSPYASTLPRNFMETPECISTSCHHGYERLTYYPSNVNPETVDEGVEASNSLIELPKENNKVWRLVTDLVQLVQLTVTATALALYYLIYCYMQLIYYSLRSALYFHQADGPMKITIGVVSVTSIIVGFNLILRLQKFFGGS